MSKKKNKKFKRSKTTTSAVSTPNSNSTASESKPDLENVTEQTDVTAETKPEQKQDDPYDQPEYEHVKKDIRKILILLGIITVLFIGAAILNDKTSALTSFGNWIYKIAHIQAQ